jgi:ribosomal protein S15P/S13E
VNFVSALIANSTSLMNVLTQASLNNSASLAGYRFQLVQNQLNGQFQKKIAALQAASTSSAEQDFLKVKISGLGQQVSTYNTLRTQYGTNANTLGSITAQLSALQNAASAGNSAVFDAALADANTLLSQLIVVNSNPLFQPDGVAQLKLSGLGINPSSSYDLSTGAGQAAALADIANAGARINQTFGATAGNQAVAGSQSQALTSQQSSLNGTLQNEQFDQQSQITLQTLKLKQALNTQTHLIELSLANAQATSKNLQQQQLQGQAAFAAAAPGSIFSIFG